MLFQREKTACFSAVLSAYFQSPPAWLAQHMARCAKYYKHATCRANCMSIWRSLNEKLRQKTTEKKTTNWYIQDDKKVGVTISPTIFTRKKLPFVKSDQTLVIHLTLQQSLLNTGWRWMIWYQIILTSRNNSNLYPHFRVLKCLAGWSFRKMIKY